MLKDLSNEGKIVSENIDSLTIHSINTDSPIIHT